MNDQELAQKAFVKWCCPGLKGHYDEAGQRGGAVLIGIDFEGRPEFTLQFRAVDKGNEELVSSETLINVIVDVGMRYCPWCGCNLDKWYGKAADALYRPDLKITY